MAKHHAPEAEGEDENDHPFANGDDPLPNLPTGTGIQLVDGDSPNEGRVLITYGGEQNLLFSRAPLRMFNNKEACRSLGLRSGGIPDVRAFEESPSIVHATLMDFKCDGTEPDLFSCDHMKKKVTLTNGVQREGTLPGITDLTPLPSPTTTTHPGNQCMARAAFRINFQHIMPLFGCVKRPMCGRRLLRIKLILHPTERPDSFTIADIAWGAGNHDDYNKDGGFSTLDGNLRVRPNNWCNMNSVEMFDGAIRNATRWIKIWIGNNYFRLKTDTGFLIERCYRCMFSLNWQFNYSPLLIHEGGPEQDIFDYLNGKYGGGGGVCRASFKWDRVVQCEKVGLKEACPFKDTVVQYCVKRNDFWSRDVSLRCHGVHDLAAAKARYHFRCYDEFRKIPTYRVPPEIIDDNVLQMLIESMYSDQKICTWTSVDLHDKYVGFGGDLSRKQMFNRLVKHLGSDVIVLNIQGCASVIGFREYVGNVVQIYEIDTMDEDADDALVRKITKGTNGVHQPANKYMLGPLIDAPPSHADTILTTLTYMQKTLVDMGMKKIHLCMDMQLYVVTKQVCWSQPTQFQNVVLHPGGMHVVQSFLSCIGKLMNGSGLEAYVSAAYGGLTGIFNGKSWVKALRAYRGVTAALLKRFLSTGLKLFEKIQEFIDTVRLHPTGRHWVDNFILPTQLVHQFVRSEREGDIYLKHLTIRLALI
ncbi:hypothetical protein ScPMuIL_002896 [Solemya velum]